MKLLFDFILVGGILITLFILVLLIKVKKKVLPQKLLFLFFSFLLLVAINAYAGFHNIRSLYLITVLFDDIVIVFVGPLLYVYIKSLLNNDKNFLKNSLAHFIPVLLNFTIITFPYFLNNFYTGNSNYVDFLNENINLIRIFHNSYLIFYLLLSLKTFVKYQEVMKINFSNFTESEFLWIKKMLIGSLLVIGFDFLLILFEVVFPEYKLLNKIDLTVVAMIIFIMYLGYYGVNQSKVLLPSFLLKEDGEPIDIIKEQKTASSINFTEEEIDILEKNLRNVFKDEKPYLDEDLTLNKLAGQIGTTDKKLSAFLNQHLQTTFYNLINKERVESVKEKLNSDEFDNLTLLGIAYESGFKSKTSFNRIFKKETGLSPSEYKKTH